MEKNKWLKKNVLKFVNLKKEWGRDWERNRKTDRERNRQTDKQRHKKTEMILKKWLTKKSIRKKNVETTYLCEISKKIEMSSSYKNHAVLMALFWGRDDGGEMAFFAQNPKSYYEIRPVMSLRHRGQGLLGER